MRYSFPQLIEILAGGKGLVLAAIVETEGSTPQVPGASAIFSSAGLMAGTVGGGLLEARVEAIAGEARRDGNARLVSIRLDADPSDMEGAICGGTARVLIDPGVEGFRGIFGKALEGLKGRQPGVLASFFVPGQGEMVKVEREFLSEGGSSRPQGGGRAGGAGTLTGAEREALETASKDGKPRLVRGEGRMLFLEPILPLPPLIIAGAGHVGRAVARLGSLLDFHVTVIDDRAEFANAGNVPEADAIVVGDIGEALRGAEDSPENYFVIVTRGHQKDAEALRAVLGRPAAYIGMIGSRTKIDLTRAEFLERGWATAEEWSRIHAPIGLDIGSKTVEEIAVSIAAELVLVRSGRKVAGLP
jgi:xanthine dehydrogenase accessory factor